MATGRATLSDKPWTIMLVITGNSRRQATLTTLETFLNAKYHSQVHQHAACLASTTVLWSRVCYRFSETPNKCQKNNKGRTLYVLYGGRCPGEQVTEGECLDTVRNTHITERTDEWFYITVTTAAPWSRAVSKQTAVTPPKNRTAVDSGMVCTQRLWSFADCSSASVREAEPGASIPP